MERIRLHSLCPTWFIPSTGNTREKCRKFAYVSLDTGPFERRHIFVSDLLLNDSPPVSARRQHNIHHKSSHSPITVHIRMYECEDEMAENCPHPCVFFTFQQVKSTGIASLTASGLRGACIELRIYTWAVLYPTTSPALIIPAITDGANIS